MEHNLTRKILHFVMTLGFDKKDEHAELNKFLTTNENKVHFY